MSIKFIGCKINIFNHLPDNKKQFICKSGVNVQLGCAQVLRVGPDSPTGMHVHGNRARLLVKGGGAAPIHTHTHTLRGMKSDVIRFGVLLFVLYGR